MRRPFDKDDLRSPGRIMTRMISDYVAGKLDTTRVLYRAAVVAIDQLGGQLETDPPNPKNSIQARIITYGYNANTLDEDLPVFWPMFPHLQEPIKENEYVYVIFEDDDRQHGLWLTRLPQQANTDSKNYAAGSAPYILQQENQLTSPLGADTIIGQLPDNATSVSVDPNFTVESVPDFTARIGDHVIHGSNNTMILLGRDRPDTVDSGQQDQAGTIDIVAGRVNQDDMDIKNDLSRVYVSAKTDIDANIGTSVGSNASVGPAIAIISDEIRILARNGIKIIVSNGDIVIEGGTINIGNNASEPAVLGNQLKTVLTAMLATIGGITASTPADPHDIIKLTAQLSSMLSQHVNVKP